MKRILGRGVVLALAGLLLALSSTVQADEGWQEATQADGLYAVLETDLGDVVCRLMYARAPLTVANFVGLAEGTREFRDPVSGELVIRPFYEDQIFHRVIEGFMIQTGDPTGLGTGGPGYRFRDELDSGLGHDRPGTLSMANIGPDSNGSQFFITLAPTPWLDGIHSVFGRVIQGMEVVEAIASSDVDKESRPVDPVHLREVRIVRRGALAEDFDAEAIFQQLRDLSESEQLEQRARDFEDRIAALLEDSLPQADGSRYTVVQAGEGETPQPGQTIRVHYVCYLPDGTVVESTRKRSHPLRLVAGEPRRGLDWELQFLDMQPGELRWVFLPPELGFGDRGIPGVVPPDSPLVFELELDSILDDQPGSE
jgi:cyclophilin family peptidyl-prolyl cis-trans isomerase